MKLEEFLRTLYEHNPDIVDALSQIGGLRGLFDPYCHEFTCSTLEQKVRLIRQITRVVNIADIEAAFSNVMERHGYESDSVRGVFGDAAKLLLTEALYRMV